MMDNFYLSNRNTLESRYTAFFLGLFPVCSFIFRTVGTNGRGATHGAMSITILNEAQDLDINYEFDIFPISG
jgi:hypothetical protein